jgi:hypothetical protein
LAKGRVADVETALAHGLREIQVGEEVNFWGGGRHSGMPQSIDRAYLAKQKELLGHSDPVVGVLERHKDLATIGEVFRAFDAIIDLQKSLPQELQGELDQIVSARRQLTEAWTAHLATVSIRTPGMVVGTMAWLCVSCLIVPLGYLSAQETRSKQVLMVAFAIGVVAIPIYIGAALLEIYRMKRVQLDRGGQ